MTKNKKPDKNDKEYKEEIKRKFEEYYETRDKNLRDELIEEHMYIVDILSNKYVGKGYEFSSFATPTIMGELKRYFRDKGWVIRVPRRIQNLYKKINNAKKVLPQELQRTPTVKDIADYLGEDEETILETMEASKVYSPQSLDMKYQVQKGENSIDLADMIGEEDRNFDSVELSDLIDKSTARLNELEKEILQLRYYEGRTQIDIAETLDISQMTVSRIEKKILQKFTLELEKMETM